MKMWRARGRRGKGEIELASGDDSSSARTVQRCGSAHCAQVVPEAATTVEDDNAGDLPSIVTSPYTHKHEHIRRDDERDKTDSDLPVCVWVVVMVMALALVVCGLCGVSKQWQQNGSQIRQRCYCCCCR